MTPGAQEDVIRELIGSIFSRYDLVDLKWADSATFSFAALALVHVPSADSD